MKESNVADQIKLHLKCFNAKPAFRTIVASGKRSARPHGWATGKRIRDREPVVIDFGALYNGYRSDITRTVIVGKGSRRLKRVWRIVRTAQAKAIRAVKPGIRCCDIDRAARGYITRHGFGKYFIHTTGHGVGKKVHQAPKISSKNRRRLREGMVLTVEPGIYIKGWGGVRIEDMFLVTRSGCKILT